MYRGAERSLGAALERRRDDAVAAAEIWAIQEGEALRTRRFGTVQLPYDPMERECEQELLPLAAELGVAVLVMRPGAGALVARPASPGELGALGVHTWPQALLKWALSNVRVDVVVPATRRGERTRENAGEPPWLDEEQRHLVERIAAK